MSPSVLQRIASGDPAAVRECIEQYGPLVWSLARRLSRTASDAEDATQEIFLDIWRSAGRFDASQGSDKVFIAMIARRRLIDRLRKKSAEPPMESADVLESVAWSDPGTSSEISLEAEQAARALAELRPEHRQVLELGLLHGLSQSEIAARLGLPLGTVKSFMRRGLIRVREYMNLDSERVTCEDLMSESDPPSQPDEILMDLLIKQVTEGLSPAEQRALDVLDSPVASAYAGDFERAAAAITLAGSAGAESLPPLLRARLEEQAQAFFASSGAARRAQAVAPPRHRVPDSRTRWSS